MRRRRPAIAICALAVLAVPMGILAGPGLASTALAVTAGACGDAATPIPQVQGSGAATPLLGQSVTVEGVVVGDFQGGEGDRGDLDGFFVQDPEGDGDPATSDGIFVFAPDADAVSPGDRVRVTGTADEFFEQTQIDDVTALAVCAQGVALPEPSRVPLPTGERSDLERFEGMRTVLDTLAVTETRNVDDFGELLLSTVPPLVEPTEVADGAEAQELAAANRARQIIVDDGRSGEGLEPIPYLTADDPVRRGDTVTDVTGVLSYGFDAYRVQPTEDVTFAPVNPRPAAPDEVGGDVAVASFNVLNYFTTLGDRGAVTPEEFDRQEAKIVAAINALGAEVVALQEIENNDEVATQTLVDALNTAAGGDLWAAVPDPAGYGTDVGTTDAITNALIYQPGAVQLVGDTATVLVDEAFDNARAPYAGLFAAAGSPFAVVSNHFKSKSCGDDATGGNAEEFPGAGCFNGDRVMQAQALAGFVADLSAENRNVLVLGDLNSYSEEDPIRVLTDAGLTDQVDALEAPDRYTFVFDGEQGVLDHAFTTAGAGGAVTGVVDVWHINADEPDAYQYNGADAFFAPDPFRASDHDPVLVGLALDGGALAPGCPYGEGARGSG